MIDLPPSFRVIQNGHVVLTAKRDSTIHFSTPLFHARRLAWMFGNPAAKRIGKDTSLDVALSMLGSASTRIIDEIFTGIVVDPRSTIESSDAGECDYDVSAAWATLADKMAYDYERASADCGCEAEDFLSSHVALTSQGKALLDQDKKKFVSFGHNDADYLVLSGVASCVTSICVQRIIDNGGGLPFVVIVPSILSLQDAGLVSLTSPEGLPILPRASQVLSDPLPPQTTQIKEKQEMTETNNNMEVLLSSFSNIVEQIRTTIHDIETEESELDEKRDQLENQIDQLREEQKKVDDLRQEKKNLRISLTQKIRSLAI